LGACSATIVGLNPTNGLIHISTAPPTAEQGRSHGQHCEPNGLFLSPPGNSYSSPVLHTQSCASPLRNIDDRPTRSCGRVLTIAQTHQVRTGLGSASTWSQLFSKSRLTMISPSNAFTLTVRQGPQRAKAFAGPKEKGTQVTHPLTSARRCSHSLTHS